MFTGCRRYPISHRANIAIRLYNTLFTFWGVHVLPRVLQMPAGAVLSWQRNRYTLFAANKCIHCIWRCCWIHIIDNTCIPKLGKSFPHSPCLNFRSPYFIWYQIMIKCTSWRSRYSCESLYHVTSRHVRDERGILCIFVDRLDLDISSSSKVYVDYFTKN